LLSQPLVQVREGMEAPGRRWLTILIALVVVGAILATIYLFQAATETPQAQPGDIFFTINMDPSEIILGVTDANMTVTVTNVRDVAVWLSYEWFLNFSGLDNGSLRREFEGRIFDGPYIVRPRNTREFWKATLNETSLRVLFGVDDNATLVGRYQVDFRFSDSLVAPTAFFTVRLP